MAVTEAARRQIILKALEAHHQDPTAERRPFPLSRGTTVLPVVSIPLETPLLNWKSFRIAPALADHPTAPLVAADPEGMEAQAVVAELVRASHRLADELKQSLKDDGQDEPGVITRAGVLINANTRCVLMRELLADGELQSTTIRVAVLPADIRAPELFDLEAVLQKQRDHKDGYSLVSELMMLRTLHDEGRMTEQQIAKRQRLAQKDVVMRFEVLGMMERARHLVEPSLPIKSFDSGKKSQLQNWKELNLRVKELDDREGPEAGDDHLREWLHLHLLNLGAVHNLRRAPYGWVDRHLLNALESGGDIASKIAAAVVSAEPTSPPNSKEDGLDLLDFGRSVEKTASNAVRSVLNLTVAAKTAGPDGTVDLPDGTKVNSNDVLRVLKKTAEVGLKDSQIRLDAGERLEAPGRLVEGAVRSMTQALKALYEAIDQSGFGPYVEGITALLDELSGQVEEARESLDQFGAGSA